MELMRTHQDGPSGFLKYSHPVLPNVASNQHLTAKKEGLSPTFMSQLGCWIPGNYLTCNNRSEVGQGSGAGTAECFRRGDRAASQGRRPPALQPLGLRSLGPRGARGVSAGLSSGPFGAPGGAGRLLSPALPLLAGPREFCGLPMHLPMLIPDVCLRPPLCP